MNRFNNILFDYIVFHIFFALGIEHRAIFEIFLASVVFLAGAFGATVARGIHYLNLT